MHGCLCTVVFARLSVHGCRRRALREAEHFAEREVPELEQKASKIEFFQKKIEDYRKSIDDREVNPLHAITHNNV